MSEFSIRPARAGDSAALAGAWVEFGYYADLDPALFEVPDDADLEEWMRANLEASRGDDSMWFVAEGDGLIVGYVAAAITRPSEDAGRQLMRDETVGFWKELHR